MRELLYINIGDSGFGVWDDEVLDVKENIVLHRLPLTSKIFAGIAEIENRIVTIADLAACVGLPQIKNKRCSALLLSESPDIAGFAIEQKVRHYEISSDKIFKLPDSIQSQIIDTCVLYSSTPIPVINIKALCRLIKNKDYSPGKIPLPGPGSRPVDMPAIRNYRYITAGGGNYAFPEYNLRDELPAPENITASVLFPDYIKGVTLYNDGIIPLVSLSRRMDTAETGMEQRAIIMDIDRNTYGFLADSVTGISNEWIKPVSLPPLVRTGWMKEALIDNNRAVPIIDPAILILPPGDYDKISPESLYTPESAFDRNFGDEDADVTEFYILNSIYSLPRSEVKDTIPCGEISKVPGAPPIVIGVTEYEGGLLPVLDLALYFGAYSRVSPDWKMMLVENGDFRAFLMTGQVKGTTIVKSSDLSRLPIRLPHNVVYGCYPDSETGVLRLILNAESMAVHFDKDYIKEFFHVFSMEAGLTKQQAEIPEEEPSRKTPPVIEDAISFETETAEEPQADEHASFAEVAVTEAPEQIFNDIKPEPPASEPGPAEDEAQPYEEPVEEIPEYAIAPSEGKAETPQPEHPEIKTLPETPPADEVQTETPAVEITPEEPAVREIPISRTVPSEKKTEAQKPEEIIEPPLDISAFPVPDMDAGAETETAGEKSVIKPAAIYKKNRPSAGINYLYATLGLLIIIMIFLISAFLLSERDTADKGKLSVTAEKEDASSRNEKIKPEEKIIRPVDKMDDKTAQDEPAGSAVIDKTAVNKIQSEVKKPGILRDRTPENEAQSGQERPSDFIIYNVIKDDQLYYITEKYTGKGFDYWTIAKDNKIENPDLIFPEQKIKIKKDYIKK